MLRRTLVAFGLVLAMGSTAPAQDQQSAARQPEQAAQARTQAPEKEREKEQQAERERQALERAKAQEQERREPGQAVNVRLELTIRDQRGTAQPETKTVSVVTADRSFGRVRTGGNVRTEKFGIQDVRLNVDARPIILRDGHVRLSMTFEYRPADTEASPSNNISETIECVLVSGQPLTVSKSADPNSDRSVTVEVRATILK